MSTKNLFYCQNCQKHLNIKSKEEYLLHRETTCNKYFDNFKETDSSTSGYNIASFTFGGKNAEGLKEVISSHQIHDMQNKLTGNFNTNFRTKNNIDSELNEESSVKKKKTLLGVGITNKLGQHNSFVSSILQLIWNMKHLRNYLLSEIILSDENKHRLLINLKVR
jgi:hypothetical protein